jgi:hypothetical protein
MATEKEGKRLDDVEARGWPADDFSADLGRSPDSGADAEGSTTRPARHHEPLPDGLSDLSKEERARLTFLREGARLEQGGVYVDLADDLRRPIKAIGGQVAGPGQLLVAKRDTDHDLWNRLVPDDAGEPTDADIVTPDEERPGGAS